MNRQKIIAVGLVALLLAFLVAAVLLTRPDPRVSGSLPATFTPAPSPTPSPRPAASPTAASATTSPTFTPAHAFPTTAPATAPAPVNPAVEEKPFTLAAGLAPSEGALSCPRPLPLARIRDDYLAYWEALKMAHLQTDAALLKPFIDQTALNGKLWSDEAGRVERMVQGRYYVEYQVTHSSPLLVKVNPYSYGGNCYVLLYDGARVASFARKKGSGEPVNDRQPVITTFPADHAYILTPRDGRWILAGEGGG
jgi:hypothetical protein